LIDACISALHIYGPSRTTVEKVVAIAKMSPGIVRFYFDSKAAMLVASLQFLAAEFEEQVLMPVSKLKQNPLAALELLVDLYLDPEIASPRKVSVWYAFWGEASSRQEYYDICGQKDESFAALVRELIGRLIEETRQPQLDTDGIALGLIGVLEMLWQDFAFRSEGDIDRPAAKRRGMAYLKSIFPGRFPGSTSGRGEQAHPGTVSAMRFAGWVYGSERAWSSERESLFHAAWQIVAHEAQIARAGDFLTADLGAERVLLTRDSFGALHALRNSCPEVPHALVAQRGGRLLGAIECRTHGFKFGLDGRRASAATRADLSRLDIHRAGGLLLVGPPHSTRPAALPGNWFDAVLPLAASGLDRGDGHDVGAWREIEVAANWKFLVEQWLESAALDAHATQDSMAWAVRPLEGVSNWSAQRYRRLAVSAGAPADAAWQQRFLAPNQLLQARPDGLSVLQVIPIASGRCRLRRLDFTRGAAQPGAHACRYLAERLTPWIRRSALKVAESAQQGVIDFGYRASNANPVAPALLWFRRHLVSRVPVLARPAPDS
jgi:TetR/AcrR family transcriptional repressor of bet genes